MSKVGEITKIYTIFLKNMKNVLNVLHLYLAYTLCISDLIPYVYGSDNPNGDLLNSFDKGEDFSIVFSKCYTEKIANILVMARALY